MTELTGLTVWGETVKKVKTVITKNHMTKNHMTKLCGERGGKSIRRLASLSREPGGFAKIAVGGYFYTRSGCEMVISAPGEEA